MTTETTVEIVTCTDELTKKLTKKMKITAFMRLFTHRSQMAIVLNISVINKAKLSQCMFQMW